MTRQTIKNMTSEWRGHPALTRSTLQAAASDSANPEPALKALPELARQLVNADYGAVTVLDSDGRVQHMYYAGMSEDRAAEIGHPPEGTGVLGRLGPADAPLRLDKISRDSRSVGFPPGHPPMDALLGVHVVAAGGLRANVYLANKPGRPEFTHEDEEKVGVLASYVRLALESSSRYRRESALRVAADQALRHLETVIDSAAAGIVIVDVQDKSVVMSNSEVRRLTGHEWAKGQQIHELLGLLYLNNPDGIRTSPRNSTLEAALATGASTRAEELEIRRPDGSSIPVLLRAAPVRASGTDRVTAAVLSILDLSPLREVDRLKREFISMVTHDLRTPVATVKGELAEVISQTDPNSAVMHYLTSMDEDMDHLSELVSNLLDMSRVEFGNGLTDKEECYLADVAGDAAKRARRSRYGAGRQIIVNVPPDLPPVYADVTQLGRVLDNLLNNALKYTDGPVTVSAHHDRESEEVVTEVEDSGDGVPEAFTRDLFDKFFRIKRGTSHGREGVGLGLALCKAVVDAHGGRIGVTNAPPPKRGACFWFSLPLNQP
ncbi:MAG: ATP-binding protein [Dehalococcoidia bacterium]